MGLQHGEKIPMPLNLVELWNTFNPLLALGLFIAYVVFDSLHTYNTIQIVKRAAFKAAFSALIMNMVIALGVINYVSNSLYIFPMSLGAAIGTYLTVKLHPRERIY